MMNSASAALALGLSLTGFGDAPDPQNPDPGIVKLIRNLGALEYRQREAATAELEKRGVSALPALREAVKSSSDPEVSERAAELMRKIATANPQAAFSSQVSLDYEETTLEEAVKGIASQTGVKIELMGNSGKPVSLREAKPLPFWNAIDRVCAAGGLKTPTNMLGKPLVRIGDRFRMEVVDDEDRLLLSPGKTVSYPSYYSRYHCVRLLKLRAGFDRELTLSFGSDAKDVNVNPDNESPRVLEFVILGKPGAKMSPNGQLVDVRIVDDQNREISNAANLDFEFDFRNRGRFGGRAARLGGADFVLSNDETGKLGILTYRVALDWPLDPPPQTFKLIRANVPVSVEDAFEPIAFRIAESIGKPIVTPAAVIEIQSITTDKATKLTKLIAKFTPKRLNPNLNEPPDPADGVAPFGLPNDLDPDRDQFTFEDGDGRSLSPAESSGRAHEGSMNYEWRFQGTVDDARVPIKMTVRIVNRHDAGIAFEFHDIPVPKARN